MLMSGLTPARSLHSLDFSFLSLGFILLLQISIGTGRELRFVVTVFRHGDRSPLANFPSNHYPESIWPQGYGQLTKEGMLQQYKLGEYLRAKYGRFLSPQYKRWEIYVLSTDVGRTIMSAQANLAGLYPPTDGQMWHPRIAWQPIPVHTVPREYDRVLFYPKLNCPRFLKLMKETLSSDAFKHKLKDYKPLLHQISSKTKYDMRAVLDMNTNILWNLYDTLFVQQTHKYRNVDWANLATMNKLKSLLELAISSVFGESKRQEKSRLQGGLLVKVILKMFTDAATNANPRKMMMYSAHDTTLIALQSALDVYDKKLPPYAACHIFELYKETNGQVFAQMQQQIQPDFPG